MSSFINWQVSDHSIISITNNVRGTYVHVLRLRVYCKYILLPYNFFSFESCGLLVRWHFSAQRDLLYSSYYSLQHCLMLRPRRFHSGCRPQVSICEGGTSFFSYSHNILWCRVRKVGNISRYCILDTISYYIFLLINCRSQWVWLSVHCWQACFWQ